MSQIGNPPTPAWAPRHRFARPPIGHPLVFVSMLRLLLALIVCGTTLLCDAQSQTNGLIGTWKVDPSTFWHHSRMKPNNFKTELPPDAKKFELTLRDDGSFTVKDGPAEFFWNFPARTNCVGTWTVVTNSDFSGRNFQPSKSFETSEDKEITIRFLHEPKPRVSYRFSWHVVTLKKRNPPSSQVAIGIPEWSNDKEAAMGVYLTKQK